MAARPWLRLSDDGETSEKYEQFIAYRDLGPCRTLDAAYAAYRAAHPARARPGRTGGAIRAAGRFREYAVKFNWQMRSEAWDDHIQARKDRAAADYAARWEVRRLEALDRAYEMGSALYRKADEMQKLPILLKRVRDGGAVTEYHPARWNYQSVTLMLKTAAELQAAAVTAAIRPTSEYGKDELEARVEARHEFYGRCLPPDDAEPIERF